jgi:hypothetical protein
MCHIPLGVVFHITLTCLACRVTLHRHLTFFLDLLDNVVKVALEQAGLHDVVLLANSLSA